MLSNETNNKRNVIIFGSLFYGDFRKNGIINRIQLVIFAYKSI